MPFTPLHMGPALLLKAGADRRFSLFAFGCAQVLMDIEPLLGLFRHAPVLHGRTPDNFTHGVRHFVGWNSNALGNGFQGWPVMALPHK